MTLDFISRLKPDIAFVGAVGVDVKENSVSTYDIDDGINKAAIIRHSKKAYVVAEARKLSTDGNYNYTTLDTLSGSSRIRSRQQTSAQQRIRTAWRSSCHDVLYARMAFAVYSVSVYLENSIYGHPGRTEGICVLPRSPFRFPGLFHRVAGTVYGSFDGRPRHLSRTMARLPPLDADGRRADARELRARLLLHYLWPRWERRIVLALNGVLLSLLSILFVASFPFYRQFHANFNQMLFTGANDDIYALLITMVQQYYLPVRLAGALLLAYVLWRGLRALLRCSWLEACMDGVRLPAPCAGSAGWPSST